MLRLKESLATVLGFFYPLAGRLATEVDASSRSSHIFVDSNNAGSEFIHAAVVDLKEADVLTSFNVPPLVQSFFPCSGAVNHGSHPLALLAVQFTELTNGVFLGFSFNHVLGDGAAFWNFVNAWSEISITGSGHISKPPAIERCFLGIDKSFIYLPFSSPDEFLDRYVRPQLRERIFHFSPTAVFRPRSKAKGECNSTEISSFQALCAHVWRSIIRARRFAADQRTSCRLVGDRHRLLLPGPPNYLGNCTYVLTAEANCFLMILVGQQGYFIGAWLITPAAVIYSMMG